MLYFFKVRIDPKGLSQDELWDHWEEEAEASLKAIAAGKILAAYKVAGQRRVVGIADVTSHDELDRIIMGELPMAQYQEWEELLPVRTFAAFANDVKRRWHT